MVRTEGHASLRSNTDVVGRQARRTEGDMKPPVTKLSSVRTYNRNMCSSCPERGANRPGGGGGNILYDINFSYSGPVVGPRILLIFPSSVYKH